MSRHEVVRCDVCGTVVDELVRMHVVRIGLQGEKDVCWRCAETTTIEALANVKRREPEWP